MFFNDTKTWLFILIAVVQFVNGQQQTDTNINQNSQKAGKVFSLFSVVQFKNSGCRSQSTMSSGQSAVRNGTCFTFSECASKGGTSSGNCASGFGVCCLFLVSTTGSVINQNCTYIRNPGFPSALTTTSALSYTINKCSSDVCYLRLDFESFTTLGPATTIEGAAATTTTAGAYCPDQFKVTTNTGQLSGTAQGQTIPIICGQNTGQHIYVDIGTVATDSATLSFTFSTTLLSTTRNWEIKVSQITCSNPNRPPNGCLQYFSTPTGRITTFNFIPTTSTHLDSQMYSICIRRQAGYCCVRYQACEGVPNAFTIDGLDTAITYAMGAIDTACTLDYISIPASSNSCSATGGKLATKYCGRSLGLANAVGINLPICDCTGNFEVGIKTNNDQESATTINRGVCLDFMQVPCITN